MKMEPKMTKLEPWPLSPKPFLIWFGSKRTLANELVYRVPASFKRYFEPFLGGGCLFWRLLDLKKAFLGDVNMELITAYNVVRDHPDHLLALLEEHKERHSEDYYYRVRDELKCKTNPEIAARMFYLNRTCYKGLYRVNSKGKFNTPFYKGQEGRPIVNYEIIGNLGACSAHLKKAEIKCQPYQSWVPLKGDFVYLDPPYLGSYDGYSVDRFGLEEHKRLAAWCREISSRGVKFMLSNFDTNVVRQIYKGFYFYPLQTLHRAKLSGAEKVSELVVRNYTCRSEMTIPF